MTSPPKSSMRNPYSWTTEKPTHVVARTALLDQATDTCIRGDGVFLLLGTKGMGKSVFIAHIEEKLAQIDEFETIRFDCPPLPKGSARNSQDILGALVEELIASLSMPGKEDPKIPVQDKLRDLQKRDKLKEIFEVYLNERSGSVERIILLYDELDAYANPKGSAAGQDYFDALEAARKKLDRQLAIVAAGGGSMLALKTILGSSIFSRAARKVLEPFGRAELVELAKPFQLQRGQEISDDVIDVLLSLSGGNLALSTYGLQKLWQVEEPSLRDVSAAFDTFVQENGDFVSSIRGAIFDFHESAVPYHVWRSFKANGGRLPKGQFTALRRHLGVASKIDDKDILDMLRAAGLIRMDDASRDADPIVATIIPSIVGFEASSEDRSPSRSLRQQLQLDLLEIMAEIHQTTPAFYRPGNKERQEKAVLVPEATFAAFVKAMLKFKGWQAELEPMAAAGFVDIKADHPLFPDEFAIIEVKIWPRHIDSIHDQIKSYFVKGVTALATLVIGETQDSTWKDEYEQRCLTGKVDGDATWKALDRPWDGYFEAKWESRVVEHFLLRLPSRSR